MNHLTILWEVPFLLLLFCPWASGWVRLGCAVSLPLFHGLMLPFLFPGYFIATGTCFALLLLPAFALDALGLKSASCEGVRDERSVWCRAP